MASNYGPKFGFRRSDESLSVREGRYTVPDPVPAGMVQGAAVVLPTGGTNGSLPGELALGGADAVLGPGLGGILVQEEQHLQVDEYDAFTSYDDSTAGSVRPGRLAISWCGSGVKVWFKNDGGAGDLLAELPSVGDQLGWDGSAWEATTTTEKFLVVTEVSGADVDSAYVEAVVK